MSPNAFSVNPAGVANIESGVAALLLRLQPEAAAAGPPVEATADRTGLNMVTGFYSSPGAASAASETPGAEDKKRFRRLE